MVFALLAPHARTSAVGDEVVIRKSYETSNEASDGSSSGSSRGQDSLLERIVAVRDDGKELIYDLPESATKEDRARSWQFPAHIFQPNRGTIKLLNRDDLEARLAIWLQSAGLDRSVCGKLIFTWSAFRIECKPESVIDTINAFDLRVGDLREGAPYFDDDAKAAGTLVRKAPRSKVETFTAELQVNPDVVLRARAESDVAVGELMQKPVSLEAALLERRKEDVSGNLSVTLTIDDAGQVIRRVRVIRLRTKRPDGSIETETKAETVERL
ncbi:hypothetical protein [Sphingomonas baiyangensis]|uniref:Uncharacterized protein n=1 Tax=Sphingomonas baiyangensis TaxID=2572576 RepID=A0A4U1L8Z1_9SPHN|nr:hypothetical protein [Sphingomonas baiyangensis]TKD52840.1 hypothetical protein FBR43_00295 [Sphingomonas baiyangensis]